MESLLPFLEFGAPRGEAELCVLLMHGLGADGHDFADVARILSDAAAPRKWRFVLPHAPEMPVTINMGMRMPAWYDIIDLAQPRAVDWETVKESETRIEALIAREPAAKLVLAGFSQGGAMSLHVGLRTERALAGILVMSGYLLESDAHPCPEKSTPVPLIGVFHGSDDPVVPLTAAERSMEVLVGAGYAPTLKVYRGMEHSLCDEEIRDVFGWLAQV